VGNTITWTAVGGYSPGTIQYYRYAWDTNAAHTWTGTETIWSTNTIDTVPSTAGTWYLHVKGYNGADVENGTYDYSVAAVGSPLMISIHTSGTDMVITWETVAGKNYRVEYKEHVNDADWIPLVPDITGNGTPASKTEPLGTTQRFYRVVVLN
jgi:hypothetical protein